jgi:hypothetical protein
MAFIELSVPYESGRLDIAKARSVLTTLERCELCTSLSSCSITANTVPCMLLAVGYAAAALNNLVDAPLRGKHVCD